MNFKNGDKVWYCGKEYRVIGNDPCHEDHVAVTNGVSCTSILKEHLLTYIPFEIETVKEYLERRIEEYSYNATKYENVLEYEKNIYAKEALEKVIKDLGL